MSQEVETRPAGFAMKLFIFFLFSQAYLTRSGRFTSWVLVAGEWGNLWVERSLGNGQGYRDVAGCLGLVFRVRFGREVFYDGNFDAFYTAVYEFHLKKRWRSSRFTQICQLNSLTQFWTMKMNKWQELIRVSVLISRVIHKKRSLEYFKETLQTNSCNFIFELCNDVWIRGNK